MDWAGGAMRCMRELEEEAGWLALDRCHLFVAGENKRRQRL